MVSVDSNQKFHVVTVSSAFTPDNCEFRQFMGLGVKFITCKLHWPFFLPEKIFKFNTVLYTLIISQTLT